MPSPTSAASHRVAERNFILAIQEGRRKASRGPGSGAIEPFMADVRYTPVTEASLAADAALRAAEKHAAGRVVAGFVIGETGCRGAGCGRGHKAHVDAARELLSVLDLIPQEAGAAEA